MAVDLAGAQRIDDLLSTVARRHPDRPAVSADGAVLDYRGLERAAVELARHMLRAARDRGDTTDADLQGRRVAVLAPNVPALVVALFAASWLRAVAVPLHARLREHEVRAILEDAQPTLVLSVPAHLGYSFFDLLARLLPALPSVRGVLFLGALGDVTAELKGAGQAPAERIDGQIAAILYTSGTTGEPRGALVTHARELSAASWLASLLGLAPRDGTALVAPIAHAFGFTCLLMSLASGGCAFLVQSTYSPRPLRTAIDAGARVVHGPPALFVSLLKARPQTLAGVRGLVAGAPPPAGLVERLERSGAAILNLYGLTEAGAVTCCRPDDPPGIRHASAGRPLPEFELRVADATSGHAGGELEIRGPAVTGGYFGRAAGSERAFAAEGWFRTGDLARIENGYLHIAGRSSELVNIGGYNVLPAEVEAALLGHPDVEEAAVVGVPDERLGEALRAFVVTRSGSDLTPAHLLAFAREQIAGYKLPYSIRVVPAIPLLPSGKPDRRALAQS